ncbi:MAG: 3-dehydroquinate synthase [Lachnospiraceae bacterium]
MKKIDVSYEGKKCYEIKLTDTFDALVEELYTLGYASERKICIVSDSHVAPLYLETVQAILQTKYPNVFSFTFPAGEAQKNLSTVEDLYTYLIEQKFDRKDLLLALGGGVVGDLTGFTAATYLRGIDFIQIPTSLLAQVDSSIGGKTGVDFQKYKNMVGAFYQPRLVYMNLTVLKTLPKKQLSSGIGEILKHGLIKDANYFNWMKEHHEQILNLEFAALEEMVYRSCLIKRDVVQRDPKEQGERALLNFGHTIGHAVEKLSDFKLYHGECVAIGMAAASFLSMKQGNLTKETYDMICETIQSFDLPIFVDNELPEEILAATKSDKKMEGNKVKFILLHQVGEAYITKDLMDEDLLNGIHSVLQ